MMARMRLQKELDEASLKLRLSDHRMQVRRQRAHPAGGPASKRFPLGAWATQVAESRALSMEKELVHLKVCEKLAQAALRDVLGAHPPTCNFGAGNVAFPSAQQRRGCGSDGGGGRKRMGRSRAFGGGGGLSRERGRREMEGREVWQPTPRRSRPRSFGYAWPLCPHSGPQHRQYAAHRSTGKESQGDGDCGK